MICWKSWCGCFLVAQIKYSAIFFFVLADIDTLYLGNRLLYLCSFLHFFLFRPKIIRLCKILLWLWRFQWLERFPCVLHMNMKQTKERETERKKITPPKEHSMFASMNWYSFLRTHSFVCIADEYKSNEME